jgi:hypothetical protein
MIKFVVVWFMCAMVGSAIMTHYEMGWGERFLLSAVYQIAGMCLCKVSQGVRL